MRLDLVAEAFGQGILAAGRVVVAAARLAGIDAPSVVLGRPEAIVLGALVVVSGHARLPPRRRMRGFGPRLYMATHYSQALPPIPIRVDDVSGTKGGRGEAVGGW